MGHIETYTVTHRILRLTQEDIAKIEERKKRRNAFPEPTADMLAFCKRLNPCPICGKVPEPSIVGEYGRYEFKMNCSGSAFHISCGDWYRKLSRAGKGWNERTKDKAQIRQDIENEKRWAKMKPRKEGQHAVTT